MCSDAFQFLLKVGRHSKCELCGSVTVERSTAKGESIVVLDDLTYVHLESIDADIPFYQGSAGVQGLLVRIAKEHEIESYVHFAALAYVAESAEKPALYFENNVQQGISLVSALMDAGVRRFIFSSSCTVYGEQEKSPVGEDCPQWPTNAYGWTKFTLERLLEIYDRAYGLKSICLRILTPPAPRDAAARIMIPKLTSSRTFLQPRPILREK